MMRLEVQAVCIALVVATGSIFGAALEAALADLAIAMAQRDGTK